MKTLATLLTSIAALAPALAQDYQHPSKLSAFIAGYKPKVADQSPAAMAKAAQRFLDTVADPIKQAASHPLDSPERQKWTNVPPKANDPGARSGDLNDKEAAAMLDLLATVLSPGGYRTVVDVMLADDRLLRGGKPRPGFGADNYFLLIFGVPSADKPWGLQFDGHHIALNMSFKGDKISFSPSFIGTQPHDFTLGDRRVIPMKGEIAQAYALINALDADQRKAAITSAKRQRIQTAAGKDGVIPERAGIEVSKLNAEQKKILMKLIRQWTGDLPKAQAKARNTALRKELDQMHFAWQGPTELESDVSFQILGPTLIIEYAGQDLGGNPLDHVHGMYRDPTNEYGAKL